MPGKDRRSLNDRIKLEGKYKFTDRISGDKGSLLRKASKDPALRKKIWAGRARAEQEESHFENWAQRGFQS